MHITIKPTHSSEARRRAGLAPDQVMVVVVRDGKVETVAVLSDENKARSYLRRCGYPHTKRAVPLTEVEPYPGAQQ